MVTPTTNSRREQTFADPHDEHVHAVASIHAQAEDGLGSHQRRIERFAAQLGRPRTIYILLGVVLVWGGSNAIAMAIGRHAWDAPPFFWLQGAVSLYAAVIGTVVLTTQTRQQRHAERRAYLELQISLTAEHKTAKLISLLEELRRDMPGVRNRIDVEANAMEHAVDPKAVMSALQETLESVEFPSTSSTADNYHST
jgi:uncharacterized membrane protein